MKERRFRLIVSNIVIVCVLAAAVGVTLFATLPSETQAVTPAINTAVYSGDTDSGAVSLMVNVYEGTEYALRIAEIIKERGFSTTFFVGGKWTERNGDTLVKLYAHGMEIGNHGYLHRDHKKLNERQNADEISLCAKLTDAYLGGMPDYANCKLFAPPSGSIGDEMFHACERLGFKVIMWTRDTIDWRDHDADLIYNRAVKDIKAGDLILMHPTECTVAALPRILDEIDRNGLRVAKVSEVI